jgi:peroxiredoxin Q/BCP
MLKVGSKAPVWQGLDQDGVERSSDSYKGKWVLLYFYPKDDTPGCTKEACGFRDDFTTLRKRIEIVGVSADSVESHQKFAQKYRLPFTIVADPSRTIIKAYGADGIIMAKRTSFLIRPTGEIAKIYLKVDPEKHPEEIDSDLNTLGV